MDGPHSGRGEFEIDLSVLEHLRGYPDELRRYSNLMKQIHPRGQSAVEFLLHRPSSGDFVETVCRFVRDGVEIVTAVEAAESAGLPPREFLGRLASRRDFPAALFRREHRALWRRSDVDDYIRRWKARGKLALHVICKSCGREFDTRLRLDRGSFEKGTLAANYHRCPHCGERLTYRKADYLTREG